MFPAGNNEDIKIKAALAADGSANVQALPEQVISILRLVKEPCGLLTPDGRLIAANASLLSLLDVQNLQARQHNLLDWIQAQDKALLQRKLLLARAKNQVYDTSVRMRMPSGLYQIQQLELHASNGTLILKVSSSQEQPAEDPHFEQIATVSLVYDKHFNLIHYSQQFCQMLGYSEEELQQLVPTSLLHPDYLPAFTNHMRGLVRRQTRGFVIELQLRHQEGHYLWVQYAASMLDRTGEEPYITAIALDITQLKKREEKLVQDQKDMNLFLDRTTHDMKGPLGSLRALYRIVELEFGHDPKVMEYFNHYHATVERLHTTVSDLLTLSQVKKGTPKLGMVNLGSMVQECLQSLCHLPDFYKITFTIRIEIKENIFIEESLLQTIIQNLLENAIKYCSETTPKVLVCIKLKEDQLLLEVSDNGIGISEEAQSRIFDMFYRATTRSTGTGLGLYILKNAVDKLKGNVRVRSVPDKGSRFIISIPYKAPLDQASLTEKE